MELRTGPCLYIVAKGRFGALHISATDDLSAELHARYLAHQRGPHGARPYLVYSERHENLQAAEARCVQLRRWSLGRKFMLIRTANPQWVDLAAGWNPLTTLRKYAKDENYSR